jgi:hypothetical protein
MTLFFVLANGNWRKAHAESAHRASRDDACVVGAT